MWTKWFFRLQCILFIVIVVVLAISKFSSAVNLGFFLIASLSLLAVVALGVVGLLIWLLSFVLGKSQWRKPALLAGACGFIPPLVFAATVGFSALSKPPIHDITTDLEQPPEFVAARKARAEGDNPLDYAGTELAATQKQAYPEIKPLLLNANQQDAFQQAENAVEALGWRVFAKHEPTGIIEAYDRSAMFGFIDDVVIRIQPTEQGVRIDMRSASRIGKGDLGANAARIQRFFAELNAQ